MIFRQLFEKETSTYTYLLAQESSRQALIIDPVKTEIDKYLQLIKELNLTLKYAMDTHVHADHVTALGLLRDKIGCQTIMGDHSQVACVSKKVKDDEIIDCDGLKIKAIYTPGHTDDSYSYVMDDRVFTGDALLIRGTGRTDFQNGDPKAAYHSLFDKLLKLPDDTLVYPAHDYKGWTVSTIGEEKAFNPRLQVKNEQEYVEIMNNLHLPNPKMMDVAVSSNLTCGFEK